MNWVDISIIIILGIFIIDGFGKSLFFEILDLISFLLAFLMSLKFYNLLAKILENITSLPHSFANVLGFIAIWYVLETIFFIIIRVISSGFKPNIGFFGEKYLSVLPSFFKGIILVAIILILIGTFPIQPQIKKNVQDSNLGSLILTKTYQIERPLKNIFGDLANDTFTFLTIKPKTNESVNLGFATNDFYFDTNLEFAMINLVNQERVKVGLLSLTYDPGLRGAARGHSADMLRRGYFSHYSPEGKDVADRSTALGINYSVIGENLAFAPSLELAHQGLMQSPGHRANILSPDYHKIGIGVANAGSYGIMFTQVFKD